MSALASSSDPEFHTFKIFGRKLENAFVISNGIVMHLVEDKCAMVLPADAVELWKTVFCELH